MRGEKVSRGSLRLFFPEPPEDSVSRAQDFPLRGAGLDTEPRDSLGGKPLLIYSHFPMGLGLEVENLSHPCPALLLLAVQPLSVQPLLPPTLLQERKGEPFIDATWPENCSAGIQINEFKFTFSPGKVFCVTEEPNRKRVPSLFLHSLL